METSTSSLTNPSQQTVSITEAAHLLGVSERTIYRMLRSGKIKRVGVSDTTALSVRLDREGLSCIEGIKKRNRKDMSDIGSDNTSDILEMLREEIQKKDRDIEHLLEQQQEMTQTIQRLQEQMFELARLVLSQNTSAMVSTEKQNVKQDNEDRVGIFARLFRVRDNKRG